jgi:hypothetical protein
MLDLGDMLTATGKKEEPARHKILDFSSIKEEEDDATYKNLRPDFDRILNDDMEQNDYGRSTS